jgi:hypothetical protein
MRGSSPALALVAPRRVRIVPRPRPRNAVPPPTLEAPPDSDAAPFELAVRATLRSVDLEDLDDGDDGEREAPPRSTIPPPLPSRAFRLARTNRHRAPIKTPRTSRPELLDGVVTALEDLTFFETLVEAASFCLVTAMRAVPSLAGLALLRDETGEMGGGYVIVYARGPRACELVRTRVAEDDPSIGAALVRGGPVALEYGAGRTPPPRHAAFGDPWTALVVPVQDERRCLGAFELVDPLDGRALGDSARETLATIARGLIEFGHGRPQRLGNVFAPEQLGLED